jgi:hypothetical protein
MSRHTQGRLEHSGRVEDYNDNYLNCRANGRFHPFLPADHYETTVRGRRVIEYRRTRECPLCGTRKTEYFDGDMFPSRTATYERPPGFLKPAGKGEAITPLVARREQVRRARKVGRRLRAV